MSVKKVRHIADIPEWFNLNNYSGTVSFSPSEWHQQLDHRKMILNIFMDPEAEFPELQSVFDTLKESPLKDAYDPKVWSFLGFDEMSGYLDSFFRYVNPINVDDAYSMGIGLLSEIGVDEDGRLRTDGEQSYDDFMREEPYISRVFSHIMINLDGSDAEIKSEFDLHLSLARELSGIESATFHITRGDIERLEKHKILPYFDLLIWEAFEKRKIYASVLIEALFLDNEAAINRGETFITETVKPFYEKIDGRFMTSLKSYVDTNK